MIRDTNHSSKHFEMNQVSVCGTKGKQKSEAKQTQMVDSTAKWFRVKKCVLPNQLPLR